MKLISGLLLVLLLSACANFRWVAKPESELNSGYTYIPIDPFPVDFQLGLGCDEHGKDNQYLPLLKSLPDNAVRMSVQRFDTKGNVSYGPVEVGATDESYRVTVDYVNSDTSFIELFIARRAYNINEEEYQYIGLSEGIDKFTYDVESVTYDVSAGQPPEDDESHSVLTHIPVYVGIGLRVVANVKVTGGSANISGLGVLGMEASANRLQGSLIVQTLGVNGKAIASALPIQSELNRTTAQAAVTAISSIKALLHDKETDKAARVVGIYLPLPGQKQLVNAIISELSKNRAVNWKRPCIR